MQIENNLIQITNPQMEQVLTDAVTQGTELSEKILKMNAMQQIDLSQLSYMGNIVDFYV